jgi:Transcription factor homologous to NACalpha-BTF3
VKEMSDITLEKIDIIRERTGVSYTDAKEALEACSGNVVDALIYIEQNKKTTMNNIYTTKDEFLDWLKDLVKKGNINRIRIKKDEKVIVDIPVNAGIAATLTVLIWPPLIAIGILTAVVTKVTIEITKDDGTVEVVNKIIKTGVKDTMQDMKETVKDVKDKVFDAASSVKDKFSNKEEKNEEENIYQYTVKFEDIDKENKDEENK